MSTLELIIVAMGFDPWYLENKLMRQSRFVGEHKPWRREQSSFVGTQTLAKRAKKVSRDTNLSNSIPK